MNKNILVFTFRIYPNKYQKDVINHTFNICREIYNLILKERAYVYNKFIMYSQRCLINKLEIDEKRFFKYNSPPKIKYIKNLNSNYKKVDDSTIYCEQIDVISAYERYFAGVSGFPKYKDINSRKIYKTSNLNERIKINGSKIVLPNLGNVKLKGDVKLPENCKIKKAVIKSDKHGKYYVSLILKFNTLLYSQR